MAARSDEFDIVGINDLGDAEALALRAKTVPAGRIAGPEDLGKVVVLLASDLAHWVVGHTVVADGGESLVS